MTRRAMGMQVSGSGWQAQPVKEERISKFS
jgi:hypothetical protein